MSEYSVQTKEWVAYRMKIDEMQSLVAPISHIIAVKRFLNPKDAEINKLTDLLAILDNKHTIDLAILNKSEQWVRAHLAAWESMYPDLETKLEPGFTEEDFEDVSNELAQLEQELEQVAQCPVCYECYDIDDASPIVLPCGHCVCQNCLSRIQTDGTRPSRRPNAEWPCPTCQQKWRQSQLRKLDIFYE